MNENPINLVTIMETLFNYDQKTVCCRSLKQKSYRSTNYAERRSIKTASRGALSSYLRASVQKSVD